MIHQWFVSESCGWFVEENHSSCHGIRWWHSPWMQRLLLPASHLHMCLVWFPKLFWLRNCPEEKRKLLYFEWICIEQLSNTFLFDGGFVAFCSQWYQNVAVTHKLFKALALWGSPLSVCSSLSPSVVSTTSQKPLWKHKNQPSCSHIFSRFCWPNTHDIPRFDCF